MIRVNSITNTINVALYILVIETAAESYYK